MLKKLLKYDLQSIFKLLIIFYSLALFFGVLVRIFFSLEYSLIVDILGQICTGAAISMMCSALINNLMRSWVRFTGNLYGDESYLSHTLPVKKADHYLSKLLCGVVTLLTTVVVIAIVLFIGYYSKENLELVKNMLLPLAEAYDSTILAILLSFVIILFLEFLNVLQCGFAGIILGHKLNNNKTAMSVLFGFVVFMLLQCVLLVILAIIAQFNNDIMALFSGAPVMTVEGAKTLIIISVCSYSALSVILAVINTKLFSKGVNVD